MDLLSFVLLLASPGDLNPCCRRERPKFKIEQEQENITYFNYIKKLANFGIIPNHTQKYLHNTYLRKLTTSYVLPTNVSVIIVNFCQLVLILYFKTLRWRPIEHVCLPFPVTSMLSPRILLCRRSLALINIHFIVHVIFQNIV